MSTPTTTTEEADRQDMGRLAAGQESGLAALMTRHGERLFHYLYRLLQDEEEAADLAQETFVRVYQHCDRFDRRRKFTTWLYAIATNLARDRARWRSRHPTVSLQAESAATGAELHSSLAAGEANPHEALVAEERAGWVREAIGALPEDLRAPLLLAEYQGLSQADISEVLGCSAKAVELRLYRARQRLRARLQPLVAQFA